MDVVFILDNLGEGALLGLQNLGILIAVATVITAFTPSRSRSVRRTKLMWILNLLAGNVRHNRNADDQ